MWKCPVCETEYGDVTVCPKCGFDGSCDYERYPTAFMVRNARSTRALRREWEQKQAPPVKGRNKRCDVAITPEQAAQGCRITATGAGGTKAQVSVPANWKDGDDVIIVPSLQDPAEIAQRFPTGFKAVRPYLRITPQPNK